MVCKGWKKTTLAAWDWNAKMHKIKQIREDIWKGEEERKEISLACYLHACFEHKSFQVSPHCSASSLCHHALPALTCLDLVSMWEQKTL